MTADTPALRSIRRGNLREGAVEVLRAAILDGDLAPGSMHSAGSLAEKLGVSPTPVREAMLELARAGLVEVLPNRGFRVTVMEDRDLDEIAGLRMLLEVPVMRHVIERASDKELDRLVSTLAEIESAADRNDVASFLVADREFHLGLLELAGNRRLVEIVAGLRDQTRLVGLRSMAASGSLRASAPEHRMILDAVRARDTSEAERIMRDHLRHTRGVWAGRREDASDEESTAVASAPPATTTETGAVPSHAATASVNPLHP